LTPWCARIAHTRCGWCENFTSLIELNSALFDNSSCQNYFQPDYSDGEYFITIYIKANKYKGPINDHFDWQRFISKKGSGSLGLNFYGFDGFDVNFTSTNFSKTTNWKSLSFSFTFAKFDFYLNGTPWEISSDGGSTCDETKLIKIVNKAKYGIFGVLNSLYLIFEHQARNSDFKKWCPLVFNNTYIDYLNLKSKPIRFYKGNFTYSNIKSATFENLLVDSLDKEILNPQVYSRLNNITINGFF
jgi:hypothetical protein